MTVTQRQRHRHLSPTLVAIPLMVMMVLPVLAQKSPSATPRQVVIYRCTDAAGNITFQNGVRCPKGQKQQARITQAPAPAAPTPVVAPMPQAAVAAPVATPAVAPAPASIANPDIAPDSLPPPPLYRCHAYTGNSYLSEDGAPKDRCVELQVSDLSGAQGRSNAQACEVQQDRCERIPDQQLCEAWSQYDKQAESLVALDNPEISAKATALHGRTRKVMTATTCASSTP